MQNTLIHCFVNDILPTSTVAEYEIDDSLPAFIMNSDGSASHYNYGDKLNLPLFTLNEKRDNYHTPPPKMKDRLDKFFLSVIGQMEMQIVPSIANIPVRDKFGLFSSRIVCGRDLAGLRREFVSRGIIPNVNRLICIDDFPKNTILALPECDYVGCLSMKEARREKRQLGAFLIKEYLRAYRVL